MGKLELHVVQVNLINVAFKIDIEDDKTLHQLKTAIAEHHPQKQEQKGLDESNIRLESGIPCKDDEESQTKTLKELGIRGEAAIEFVNSVFGGMERQPSV